MRFVANGPDAAEGSTLMTVFMVAAPGRRDDAAVECG